MFSNSVSRLLLGAAGALTALPLLTPADAQPITAASLLLSDGTDIQLTRLDRALDLDDLDRDDDLTAICQLIYEAGRSGLDVADANALASVLDDTYDVFIENTNPVYVYRWDEEVEDFVVVCTETAKLILEPDSSNPIQVEIGERVILP